jgi:SAM-dependent methyltransferase
MAIYDPRIYFPDRLEREGALYVSTRNSKTVNDKQWEVFRDGLMGIYPQHVGRVLDFGCGVGRFAETVMEVADSYVGVDIAEGAFSFAPQLDGVSYTALPEDRIPFDDGEFDSVIAVTVLQHIVEPEQYRIWSSELSRVVKPGGFFLVIDDAHGGLKGYAFDFDPPRKRCSHMNVRGPEIIAESLGAEVEESSILTAERKNSHHCFRARKRDS